jgi:hypothetical protein
MSWKVEKGKRYLIEVTLNWMESFAPDSLIVSKFIDNGFANVSLESEGGGKIRKIAGTWPHPDTVIPPEKHLTSIKEIKE